MALFKSFLKKRRDPQQPTKVVENPQLVSPGYADRHPGSTFLVLANGPSLERHKEALYALIGKVRPVIMGGNNIADFIYPDYHAFTNRNRFCSYAHTIDPRKSRVLLSPYLAPWIIQEHYRGDYELLMYKTSRDQPFNISDGIVQCDCRTVSVLLIAIALIMGAGTILVAGLDGYSKALGEKTPLFFYDEQDVGRQPSQLSPYLLEVEGYCQRYLDEISNYMLASGKKPFQIVTPTVYSAHYVPIDTLV